MTAGHWLDGDGVDYRRLRAERLGRFQEAMRARGVAVCLLFHPANIRYVTGAAVMDVYCAGVSARYCVVAADGAPVLFEYDLAIPYSAAIVADVRPAGWWQFTGRRRDGRVGRAVAAVSDVLRELGVAGEPVAVDRADALALLALQEAGLRVTDAGPVSDAAREIKTPEEIRLLRLNGAVGDAMMADFAAAIQPGVREHELYAVLSEALLRRRGEVLFTRLVASGPNTNPWGAEAGDRVVRAGDLVGVDTDAVGYQGYLIDFSRTFLCGDGPPAREQAGLYRVAHDFLAVLRESVRPGISYAEYAATVAPELPGQYHRLRYPALVHGAGLEDEGPIINYPGQGDNPGDEFLRENMVLCLESYAGAAGGPFGVKLEDQILLTAGGAEILTRYPFDQRLLDR